MLDERRREGEEIGGEGGWKGEGVCVCVCVCGRERQKEKRQTVGAAAGGRVTAKGSVRQSSGNDRSRDTEKRGEDGARGRLHPFLLRSFASLYRS